MSDSERFNTLRGYSGASGPRRFARPGKIFVSIIAFLVIACAALEFGPPLVGCPIKGNISIHTERRLYHFPGQLYYFTTRINWFRGERWFCSEAAARAAGWRKAKI